jgi:hypothetical protein
VTHEYTILTGGTVITGGDAPDGTAIAWARDIVLLVGSDDDVRSLSRGDSHFFGLRGAYVMPPAGTKLEPGVAADFDVFDTDPRAGPTRTRALIRGGRVTEGSLG